MNRHLPMAAAFCGMSLMAAACSENWIAGDPPEVPRGAYVGDLPEVQVDKHRPFVPEIVEMPESKTAETAGSASLTEISEDVENLPPVAPVEETAVSQPAAVSQPVAVPDIVYTVQKNDTLGEIAHGYNMTATELAAYNGIKKDAIIFPGQKLKIPGDKVSHENAVPAADVPVYVAPAGEVSVPVPLNASGKESTGAAAADASGRTIHTVKSGDMLSKLAITYKVKAADIAAANNITLKTILYPGQKLVIPTAGTKPAATASAAAPQAKKEEKQPVAATPAAEPAAAADPAPESSASDTPVDIEDVIANVGTSGGSTAAPAAPAAEPAAVPAAAPAAETDEFLFEFEISEAMSLRETARRTDTDIDSAIRANPGINPDEKMPRGTKFKLPIAD